MNWMNLKYWSGLDVWISSEIYWICCSWMWSQSVMVPTGSLIRYVSSASLTHAMKSTRRPTCKLLSLINDSLVISSSMYRLKVVLTTDAMVLMICYSVVFSRSYISDWDLKAEGFNWTYLWSSWPVTVTETIVPDSSAYSMFLMLS
jgi:hypothetical protein